MKEPKRGMGALRWNFAGWFGAQIGSALWMVILGGILVHKDIIPGLLVLGCGLMPNVLGVALWSRRDRIAPYAAIQTLFVVTGLCALLAFVTMDLSGHFGELEPHLRNPRYLYALLLVFPPMMATAYVQERSGKNRNTQ